MNNTSQQNYVSNAFYPHQHQIGFPHKNIDSLFLLNHPIIKLHHLKTQGDIEKIYHLRQEISLTAAQSADPNFYENEKKRDQLGFVYAFEIENKIIGTIRFVPMCYALTLTEKLLDEIDIDRELCQRTSSDWEAGRLVLDPNNRLGVDFLKDCLFLSLRHLFITSTVRNLFASCNCTLSRLYSRFGFSTLAKSVSISGIDKTYTLIRGDGLHVLNTLRDKNMYN